MSKQQVECTNCGYEFRVSREWIERERIDCPLCGAQLSAPGERERPVSAKLHDALDDIEIREVRKHGTKQR